jgi:plasmid stabilization system protein ParE
MTLKLVIRRAAERDVADAMTYYESRREHLGREFFDDLRRAVDAIRERPLSFPIVHGDIRRALLGKYPYGAYFRMRGQTIVVIAVMHGSRDPHVWQSR